MNEKIASQLLTLAYFDIEESERKLSIEQIIDLDLSFISHSELNNCFEKFVTDESIARSYCLSNILKHNKDNCITNSLEKTMDSIFDVLKTSTKDDFTKKIIARLT